MPGRDGSGNDGGAEAMNPGDAAGAADRAGATGAPETAAALANAGMNVSVDAPAGPAAGGAVAASAGAGAGAGMTDRMVDGAAGVAAAVPGVVSAGNSVPSAAACSRTLFQLPTTKLHASAG